MSFNMSTIQEERLVAEFVAWVALQGLPHECAEELLEREDLTEYQIKWLYDYCNRWEFAASGHYWINGTHVPANYPEHARWIASDQYVEFMMDWDKPFIPEGFDRHHDDTNLKPGLTVRKS